MKNKIIHQYQISYKRLGKKGNTWKQHILDLYLIIGVPISLLFLGGSISAFLGLSSIVSNGEKISGLPALMDGLGVAFLAVPIMCIFVGSMDYLVTEIFKK